MVYVDDLMQKTNLLLKFNWVYEYFNSQMVSNIPAKSRLYNIN